MSGKKSTHPQREPVTVNPGDVYELRIEFDAYTGQPKERVEAVIGALPALIAPAIFDADRALGQDFTGEVDALLEELGAAGGMGSTVSLLGLRQRLDRATVAVFVLRAHTLDIADLPRLHYAATMAAGAVAQIAER